MAGTFDQQTTKYLANLPGVPGSKQYGWTDQPNYLGSYRAAPLGLATIQQTAETTLYVDIYF